MLSAIERGDASPTASLLVRIASAFGMTLSSLIARAESGGGGLARAADQPEWRDPATGYVRRHLSPASDMPLELIRVELPAGASVSFPASSYAFIRQQIWLIAGRLDFTEGEQVHAMAAGRLPGAGIAGRLHVPCAGPEAGDLSGRADRGAERQCRAGRSEPTMAGRRSTTTRGRPGARAMPMFSLPGGRRIAEGVEAGQPRRRADAARPGRASRPDL